MDAAYLETLFTALRADSNVERLEHGLSRSEFDAIQRKFRFTFPYLISMPCSNSRCQSDYAGKQSSDKRQNHRGSRLHFTTNEILR